MHIMKKGIMIPKTANEYYKQGVEELDNPKYFCMECEKPLYSKIMLSVEHDRSPDFISVGYKPPTKFWYMCINKGCNQERKELPKIMLEDSRIIHEIWDLLKPKFEEKKEDSEVTEE